MATKYEIIPWLRLGEVEPRRRERGILWPALLGREHWPELFEEGRAFEPKVDLRETEEAYELSAEVPGLKPEEIELSLHGDVLTLKGEKKEEEERTEGEWRLVERRFGSFYRSFRLPRPVEREKLSAVHKEGVLRVVLPKLREEEPARIEVKTG